MFQQLPALIDELKGGSDAAPLVDAAVGWGRIVAAGEAQRLALLAEWAALWLADADEDSCLGAVDEEDDVVAEIGMAFGVSRGWAYRELQIGVAMRERFPKLAALFLRGEISAKVMATVVERTLLVVDDEALAAIDTACVAAALECGWSGLSYYKLKNAVDVWIERYDPDAVRRVRNTMRGREVRVHHNDDRSGVTTIVMRLSKPGATLFMGRVRTLAKGVCANDPRTLDQRMADAAEALGADADHLKCLCGSPTCTAAADDGVASRFVVHIYGEAALLESQPDALIHGEGVFPRAPENVPAVDSRTAGASEEQAQAEAPSPCDGADVRPGSAAGASEEQTGGEPAPGAPRQCAAPVETEAVDPATDQDVESEGRERPERGLPPGFIPGFGVVPNALIAALLAAGAEVRHVKPPPVDPADGYRIRDVDREFARARDLTCRMPGCDRPIDEADLDHTIAWGAGGPTHASNIKGYCRHDHLIKTFRDGWSDAQNPDGTIRVTTPTGHTYTSIPLSRLLFPAADVTSAPVQRGSPRTPPASDKSVKMPKRKRSKAKDRAYRIAAERALNAVYRAERDEELPP